MFILEEIGIIGDNDCVCECGCKGGGGGSGSPPASGASLSSASSEVAEGQRMDSAANAGVKVDAGTTNNNSGSTGQKPKQIADTYNASFVNSYYAKPA